MIPLADRFGRTATDLRVSVTDRCNLRCTYGMPAEGLVWERAEITVSPTGWQGSASLIGHPSPLDAGDQVICSPPAGQPGSLEADLHEPANAVAPVIAAVCRG